MHPEPAEQDGWQLVSPSDLQQDQDNLLVLIDLQERVEQDTIDSIRRYGRV